MTNEPSRGFTLVEMLVVLSIILVMATVILTAQSGYNRSVVLNDTAYTVASSLRLAQTYGISSRSYNGGSLNNAGYGLFFDRLATNRYVLFADINNQGRNPSPLPNCPTGTAGQPDFKIGDCLYVSTGSPADLVIATSTFNGGFRIRRFCAITSTSLRRCSDASANGRLAQLYIVFQRPNTTTIITGRGDGQGSFDEMKCAEIHVGNADDTATRVIRVSRFGEISLNQSCPLL